jgi:acetyl esterase
METILPARMEQDADKQDIWGMFDNSTIDPKVDAFNRMTAQALKQLPALYTIPLAVTRAERANWARSAVVSDAVWRSVPNARSDLRVRVLPWASPRAVYFHVHGGGWVLGGAAHQDALLDEVRRRVGVTVISVEYRLAPEFPFPAPLDDVEDALRWLLDEPLAAGVDRIIVGGESAGANLVVAALTRLRGHPRFPSILAACLNYGTFDLTGTPSLHTAEPGTPFLDLPLSRWFREQYASPELQRHPEVSPMYADLTGLPLALFLVGTVDPVRDDTVFMWTRWRMAGSPAELMPLAGALHGVLEWRTPLTKLARTCLTTFLERVLK